MQGRRCGRKLACLRARPRTRRRDRPRRPRRARRARCRLRSPDRTPRLPDRLPADRVPAHAATGRATTCNTR
ncbi:MAG: hypothetical protein FJ301_10315 [Planctomycetes bacterium]|nr:hypothetical protein [Planctomycetota bacterium]